MLKLTVIEAQIAIAADAPINPLTHDTQSSVVGWQCFRGTYCFHLPRDQNMNLHRRENFKFNFRFNSTVLWAVTPCSSETAQHLGLAYRLYFHGRRPSKRSARSKESQDCRLLLAWLALRPWKWRRCVPPKCRALSELQGVTNHKSSEPPPGEP
jgi:hypothetical protein